jgi:diguanylate cyclase (GGDEF)-like protein
MKIPTIKQIIVRITAIIASIELAIMIVFMYMSSGIGPYVATFLAFLNVTILVVLSTPIIYFWIIKPYVVAHGNVLDQVNYMAYHDPLTELPNRRLLVSFLEKLMPGFVRHKSYGALMFIDLDGFKIINDKNGHDAGDAILIEIAKRLKFLLRAEDIVSRVGGDEFVVVLGQLDADEQTANNKLLFISERIQKELSKAINFKNMTLQIGSSIGLCLLTPERTSVEAALKDADTAMYRAKQAGKGCTVVFNNGQKAPALHLHTNNVLHLAT